MLNFENQLKGKKMRKLFVLIGLLSLLITAFASVNAENTATQLLASQDGLVSLRVPSGWYIAADNSDDYSHLVAAPTPTRAAETSPVGSPLIELYLDSLSDVQLDAFLTKTIKDHGLGGIQ